MSDYPRITIVTPSYNQGRYIGKTIESVLSQGYPNLEYIIIDGGSTDDSPQIIESYADQLAYWVSEPDNGQYDAINKGFSHATGDIMAYLNSDDMYCAWTLHQVAEMMGDCPEIEWLTSSYPMLFNPSKTIWQFQAPFGYTKRWFEWGWHLGNRPDKRGWIQQESTFWRRSLWEKAGGRLDSSLHYAGDFELWAQFWQHTHLVAVPVPLSLFRLHAEQKTTQLDAYIAEAEAVLARFPRETEPPTASQLKMATVGANVNHRFKKQYGGLLSMAYYNYEEKRWQVGYRWEL